MPRPTTAERDRVLSETRQRLLEVAAQEFAHRGFDAANVNTISTRAGFAKGTIYNHFPSKRALMEELIDSIAISQTKPIQAEVARAGTRQDKLERFFEAGFRFVEENPEQARVAIAVAYGADASFRERLYQAYEALFRLLIEDVLGGDTSVTDQRLEETSTFAAMIMAVYLGASSQTDSDGKIWLDPQVVTRFVLKGIEI